MTDALARVPHAAFLICGGVFLLGIPGIALARDESALDPPRKASNHNATASWLDIIRTAPTIVAGAGLFAAFDTIVLSFLPLVALDHGMSRGRALGAVFIVLAGDAMLQFAAGYLADRFGRARVHAFCGLCVCVLLPLLPVMILVPGLWELYLFVLGGVAGALYTLSMVSSGERFSGAALVRASGLIALTWNLASSVGPAATGIVMQHFGSGAVTAVLWIMALGFMLTARIERRLTQPAPASE